jgi:hypothetical protein
MACSVADYKESVLNSRLHINLIKLFNIKMRGYVYCLISNRISMLFSICKPVHPDRIYGM